LHKCCKGLERETLREQGLEQLMVCVECEIHLF
jgi:hypothetical protein